MTTSKLGLMLGLAVLVAACRPQPSVPVAGRLVARQVFMANASPLATNVAAGTTSDELFRVSGTLLGNPQRPGTIFFESAPETIPGERRSGVAGVLTQRVPTTPLPSPAGGTNANVLYLAFGGAGALLGLAVAGRVRTNKVYPVVILFLLGLLAAWVISGQAGERHLWVDNASPNAYAIRIEPAIEFALPARSHVQVVVSEGIHNVTIRDAAGGTVIGRGALVIDRSDTYVWNLFGKNTYAFRTYAPASQ